MQGRLVSAALLPTLLSPASRATWPCLPPPIPWLLATVNGAREVLGVLAPAPLPAGSPQKATTLCPVLCTRRSCSGPRADPSPRSCRLRGAPPPERGQQALRFTLLQSPRSRGTGLLPAGPLRDTEGPTTVTSSHHTPWTRAPEVGHQACLLVRNPAPVATGAGGRCHSVSAERGGDGK